MTKLFPTFAALLIATAAYANISKVAFTPSGVPAFVDNRAVSIGQLTLQSDVAFAKGSVTVSVNGTAEADLATLWLGGTRGERQGDRVTFNVPINLGDNRYTVFAEVPKSADLTHKVMIEGNAVRIGSIVTRPHQEVVDVHRKSKNFRIPGIVETKSGKLVAVFDNRFNHGGDLPADITVGISVSDDYGVTWSPIRTAIDYKGLPGGHGIGDPAILVDSTNNRLWIAALRAPRCGHPIWTSSKGTIDPKDCGQFILAYSDDEGATWSKPINITESVKRLGDPDTTEWGLLFQGPGAGITMKNGTLVFPAQVWGHKGKAPHHGVLVYSTDHGKTWKSSKAMPWGGSESTVAELPDGSLIFNTREGGGPATRITARTTDLGETWEKVQTTPLRQPNNLCQAAYLSLNGKLYFSNPDSAKRSHMTLRVSEDNGKTWHKKVVYDPRDCAGYSSLCPVQGNSVGVIYEGTSDYHYFVRIPEAEFEAMK